VNESIEHDPYPLPDVRRVLGDEGYLWSVDDGGGGGGIGGIGVLVVTLFPNGIFDEF
jgi:hypothetical protein